MNLSAPHGLDSIPISISGLRSCIWKRVTGAISTFLPQEWNCGLENRSTSRRLVAKGRKDTSQTRYSTAYAIMSTSVKAGRGPMTQSVPGYFNLVTENFLMPPNYKQD